MDGELNVPKEVRLQAVATPQRSLLKSLRERGVIPNHTSNVKLGEPLAKKDCGFPQTTAVESHGSVVVDGVGESIIDVAEELALKGNGVQAAPVNVCLPIQQLEPSAGSEWVCPVEACRHKMNADSAGRRPHMIKKHPDLCNLPCSKKCRHGCKHCVPDAILVNQCTHTATSSGATIGNEAPEVPAVEIMSIERSVSLDSIADTQIDEESQPAADTFESQERLLGDREALGRRYSRFSLSKYSGCRSSFDYTGTLYDDATAKIDRLYDEVIAALEKIPEGDWNSRSRKNVRPKGEAVSKQMTLGLSMGITTRRIPCVTKKTFMFPGLVKLLLRYMNALAEKQGLDDERLKGTSIQLTRNMRSRPHRDLGNGGISYATAVGEFHGGQLCVEDPWGDIVHELDEDLARVGKKGDKFKCKLQDVRRRIVPFHGKRDIHFTMPWMDGDRYAIILFSLGTKSSLETPPLTQEVLKEFGFRLPPSMLGRTPLSKGLMQLARKAVAGQRVKDQVGRHLPPGCSHYASDSDSTADEEEMPNSKRRRTK